MADILISEKKMMNTILSTNEGTEKSKVQMSFIKFQNKCKVQI